MNSSRPLSTPPQNFSLEPESTIVQKQRRELQLLIAELKDRDQELNEMVAVHQRQFLAWEEDRQKTLTLGERCSRLENELQQRNEMITTLTRRLKVLESQQSDRKSTLESTQQKLQELSRKASNTSLHCQALEDKNKALNYSVIELSNKVGQLQAREQELLTMLKLKDNDILEATNHITEFTCKFKKLEHALRAAKMEELNVNKEKQNFKLRLKEVMLETNKLKGDLSEKTKENNEQREEIIQLKQENTYLSNELMLSAERANRRDQLLLSARSKQLRTDTELNNLRQIYVKQQRDLQFLHFNLESSQETKQKPEPQEASRGMVLSDLEGGSDRDSICSEASLPIPCRFVHLPSCGLKNTFPACPASQERQQASPAEKQPASVAPAPDGLFDSRSLPREEPKRSSPRRAGEAENGSAARLEPSWKTEGREAAWALEGGAVTPLPIHEHWLGLKPCAGTFNGLASQFFDKSSGDCKEVEIHSAGTWPNLSRPPRPGNAHEVGCHPCSAVRQAERNQAWVQIFKPVEDRRRCSEFSRGPQASAPELKRDLRASLNVFDWDVPCLTSTQKLNGHKTVQRPPGSEAPSDLKAPGRGYPSLHHDSITNKLQRLLAESRQMVADLELSTLLGTSPNPNDSLHPATAGPESFCEGRLPAAEGAQMTLSRFSL